MIRQVEKNEVVVCLNSLTLPFLPCLITFCGTHSYTSYFYEIFATCSCTFFITKVYFFYADYGILYEEPLVHAKNTSRVAYIYMIYVHVHNFVYISLSLMTTFSNNMAPLTPPVNKNFSRYGSSFEYSSMRTLISGAHGNQHSPELTTKTALSLDPKIHPKMQARHVTCT